MNDIKNYRWARGCVNPMSILYDKKMKGKTGVFVNFKDVYIKFSNQFISDNLHEIGSEGYIVKITLSKGLMKGSMDDNIPVVAGKFIEKIDGLSKKEFNRLYRNI